METDEGKNNQNIPNKNGSELKTAPKNKLAEKFQNKSKKHKRKIVFYYSFLTFVLLFCIVQVGFSVILNTSKTIAYHGKINTMNKVRDEAEQKNKDLKNDIKLFSKTSSLEEIARNNLKMAGDKEVLVIINNSQTTKPNTTKKKKKTKREK